MVHREERSLSHPKHTSKTRYVRQPLYQTLRQVWIFGAEYCDLNTGLGLV
jgi:hypothetical protein